ncbi:MAG: hypothetical protein JO227_16185 [Acetobacteraceae bacterium]|nr:hypothetical protein [Acetobacteraceae bacterium]
MEPHKLREALRRQGIFVHDTDPVLDMAAICDAAMADTLKAIEGVVKTAADRTSAAAAQAVEASRKTGEAIITQGVATTDNVIRLRAWFADADDPAKVPHVESVIASLGIPPAMVVESSPGKRHYYWLTDDCPLDEFKPIQSALCHPTGYGPITLRPAPRDVTPRILPHQRGTVPRAFGDAMMRATVATAEFKARLGATAPASAGHRSTRAGGIVGTPPERLRPSRLNANARAGLFRLDEFEAAGPFLPMEPYIRSSATISCCRRHTQRSCFQSKHRGSVRPTGGPATAPQGPRPALRRKRTISNYLTPRLRVASQKIAG